MSASFVGKNEDGLLDQSKMVLCGSSGGKIEVVTIPAKDLDYALIWPERPIDLFLGLSAQPIVVDYTDLIGLRHTGRRFVHVFLKERREYKTGLFALVFVDI
jgi:hypothetical protein